MHMKSDYLRNQQIVLRITRLVYYTIYLLEYNSYGRKHCINLI